MIKCHHLWFLHQFQELIVKHLPAHHCHHISYITVSFQQLCKIFIRMHSLKVEKRHQLHKQCVQIFLESKKQNQFCVTLFPFCLPLHTFGPGRLKLSCCLNVDCMFLDQYLTTMDQHLFICKVGSNELLNIQGLFWM